MPGAEAQQAGSEMGVCICRKDRKEMKGREETHSEGRGMVEVRGQEAMVHRTARPSTPAPRVPQQVDCSPSPSW